MQTVILAGSFLMNLATFSPSAHTQPKRGNKERKNARQGTSIYNNTILFTEIPQKDHENCVVACS